MVDAGAGDVQLLPGDSQNLGNLALAVNLTVAQADGFDPAVFIGMAQVAMALGLE